MEINRRTLDKLFKEVRCLKCKLEEVSANDIYVNGGTYDPDTMTLILTDTSGATPDVTIDLSALVPNTLYNANDTVGSNRVAVITDTLTFRDGTTIMRYDDASGTTIISGVGINPIGFGVVGDLNILTTTSDFDGYSGLWDFGGTPYWQAQLYSNLGTNETATFLSGITNIGGTDRPFTQNYYWDGAANFNGFEVNTFGERILSQSSGLNRLSALGVANGIAFLSGAGGTGYIGVADQDGFVDWLNNYFGASGWGGIYTGSGSTQAGTTTVTIPSGGSILFDGDFAGTLLLLDGDTGKITFDGLVDPSGLQLTPQASNPGDAQTLWSNSGDSNNPYWGPDRLARYSELIPDTTLYTNDGTLTGNRIVDGDGNELTFNNNDRFTVEADTRFSAIAGDIAGFFGSLDFLALTTPFPFKSVRLSGGDNSVSQLGSLQIGDNAGFGGIYSIWQLTNDISGRSQEFTMRQDNGMHFISDVPDLAQPYGFEYDDFNTTDAGSVRSRLGHYNDIAFLGSSNDTMGWYTYKRRVDAAIDNGDIFEAQSAVDLVTETLTTYVNENASGKVSRIVMQSDNLEISVEEAGLSTNKLGVTLTDTTYTIFDNIGDKGMVYAADYSANGTPDPRWIPDYGAVQTAIAAAVDNTIYNTDGSLTGNRTVSGAFSLTFNGMASFNAFTSGGMFFEANSGNAVFGGPDSQITVDIDNNNITSYADVNNNMYGTSVNIEGQSTAFFGRPDDNFSFDASGNANLETDAGNYTVAIGGNISIDNAGIGTFVLSNSGNGGTSLTIFDQIILNGETVVSTNNRLIAATAVDSPTFVLGGNADVDTNITLNLSEGSLVYDTGEDRIYARANATWEQVAWLSDVTANSFYTANGSITGNRTVTGDENLWLFTNTNFRVVTGDGANIELTSDRITAGSAEGFKIVQAGLFLSEPTSINQTVTFQDLGGTAFDGVLQNADLTAARTWTLPDASGTLALAGAYDTGQGYTVTNTTIDRTYDADSSSVDELADILGTLIADLQGVGILS
jgi:hypothetical protein